MPQLENTFNKQYYLPAVCDGDGGDAFGNIYFENNCAYASDRHALVRVPLELCLGLPFEECEKLNGFCIPAKLMKILYNFDPIQIELGEDLNQDTGEFVKTCTIWAMFAGAKISFELARNRDEKMPDFEAIFNARDERKPIRRIGINPGTLSDLAKAMNISTVAMRFTSADKKIYIEQVADDGLAHNLVGVIMPVVLEGVLPGFEEDGDDDETEE